VADGQHSNQFVAKEWDYNGPSSANLACRNCNVDTALV
jgi:hypothetical protein